MTNREHYEFILDKIKDWKADSMFADTNRSFELSNYLLNNFQPPDEQEQHRLLKVAKAYYHYYQPSLDSIIPYFDLDVIEPPVFFWLIIYLELFLCRNFDFNPFLDLDSIKKLLESYPVYGQIINENNFDRSGHLLAKISI